MPSPAVKPVTPPTELMDRTEGWGLLGRIYGYPEFKDDGEWPLVVVHQDETEEYPTETSDGLWTHEIDGAYDLP